jgi:hypothetical protein
MPSVEKPKPKPTIATAPPLTPMTHLMTHHPLLIPMMMKTAATPMKSKLKKKKTNPKAMNTTPKMKPSKPLKTGHPAKAISVNSVNHPATAMTPTHLKAIEIIDKILTSNII